MACVTFKIRSRMRWAPELRFPVFCDDNLAISEVIFKLSACIVHLGGSVMNGHYRALLVQDDAGRNVLRYCDDGIKSRALTDFESIAGDVYVLFFIREISSSQ